MSTPASSGDDTPQAVPEHDKPVMDKPSLPIMELHEDYKRPEEQAENDAAATPSQASLFSQMQAAQESGGVAASAAILLARSQELLGMSTDPNSLLSEETKNQLSAQGAELKGFADMLMASPQSNAVTSMWNTLASKYNNEGSGLTNEALNLWTQMSNSAEAKELTDASWDVIKRWQEYAATTAGHQILSDSGQMIKNQSGTLASLLQSLTFSLAGTAATAVIAPTDPSVSPAPSSASSIAPSASPAIPTLQKEQLMKTTQKINQALADDDDVKELIARSSNLLKSYSKEPLKSPDGSPLPPAASPSSNLSDASVDDPNVVAGDAAATALKASEAYLKSLRESETGSKMLAKATVLLQQNKDLLMPENLTSMSATLVNDVDARQQFITRTKDVALEFLLSYLPTVVVPPIVGEKEKVAYEIHNIDLGGFKVDSNNVVVTIDQANSIEIRATNISCAMKNLIWKYKKLSFPKLSGQGTADANASEVEFVLKLKLAYPKKSRKSPSPDPLSSSTRRSSASANSAPPRRPSSSASSASPALSSSPPKGDFSGLANPHVSQERSQEEKEAAAALQAERKAEAERAKSASIAQLKAAVVDVVSPAALSKRLDSTPKTSNASDDVAEPSPPAVAAAPSTAASASAPATATIPVPAAPAPVASPASVGESILNVVNMDIGQPKLVMDSCHLKLKAFEIQIHTGYFKAVYNLLLSLFSDTVKQYLENTLNNEMISKSVYLLDTINVFAVDYIPLLQRIMVKATQAAMAEDTPEGAAKQKQLPSTSSSSTADSSPAPSQPSSRKSSTAASAPSTGSTLQPSLASFYGLPE